MFREHFRGCTPWSSIQLINAWAAAKVAGMIGLPSARPARTDQTLINHAGAEAGCREIGRESGNNAVISLPCGAGDRAPMRLPDYASAAGQPAVFHSPD